MPLMVDDVMQRLRTTRAVQVSLAPTWVWKKKALVDWDEGIAALESDIDTVADAATQESGARGALDEAVKQLHEQTKRCVGVAKAEFAEDPTVRAALVSLTAPRTSLAARLAAAQALASAWEQHFPTWEPLTGFSLTDYEALRSDVQTKRSALEGAIATTKEKKAGLAARAKSLDKDAKAWYAVASRLFPTGTPEGTLLRAELP